MRTFEDFQKANSKEEFIKKAIDEFINSEKYRNAQLARLYAKQDNESIANREFHFLIETEVEKEDGTTCKVVNSQKSLLRANNKIANGMFGKIVKQKVQYTVGNGISIDEAIKKNMPSKIDRSVQRTGLNAAYFGTAWAYVFINEKGKFDIKPFKGEEFIPLIEEYSGNLRAGIRFWELNDTRFIELYEEDGLTTYKQKNNNKLEVHITKKNYLLKQVRYGNQKTTIGELNPFGKLPICEFSNNEEQISDFKTGIKRQLDLYDIVLSDFGNNLEDNLDVYWVLENYNGQSVEEFKRELEYFKAIRVGDQGKATPHTTEVPYQARQVALDILRKQIYSDAMALDVESIKGGSLTNVAIMVAMADLDLKASEFEWGALDFVEQLVEFWKIAADYNGDIEIADFVRRTLINDSEIISNLAMSSDLSEQTRTEKHPYSAKDEMERKRKEALENYKNQGIIEEEEEEEKEEDASKGGEP